VLIGIGAAAIPVVLAALYKIFQRKKKWVVGARNQ
jgi:hypothetical protein